jgi:hypothetical protein
MKDFKPCDICVEKHCKSEEDKCQCNCETCAVKDKCPKRAGLSATIRITTKCTQSCKHCCWSSSPNSTDMMSVEMAKNIAKFIRHNPITRLNLMGGEIFCNPNYKEILSELIPTVDIVRIVSNSDWAEHDESFAQFLSQFKNVYIALSNDIYHTNKNVKKAEELLKRYDIITKKDEEGIVNPNSVVPIGKSRFGDNIYSFLACYCHNPEHQYSFLIDEKGKIYKCVFGVWDYADVNDFLEGGFTERFKEFNKVFYKTFIPNCASCIRGYNGGNE